MTRRRTPQPSAALGIRVPVAVAEAINDRLRREPERSKTELIVGILRGELPPLTEHAPAE